MNFSPKALLGLSTEYAAQHDAPTDEDWEKWGSQIGKMTGNPRLADHIAYYRKAIVNGITFIGSSNLLVFLPDNLKWIGAVVALIGWALGVAAKNGDKPGTLDPSAWVAAVKPPKSDRLPPVVDAITEPPAPSEPAMSEESAEAQVEREDAEAIVADPPPPTKAESDAENGA